jgi:hypothetical protein
MKREHKRVERLSLQQRAELALREAVDDVISEHARLRLPLFVGKNGRVVKLSPRKVRDLSRSNHRKRLS